MTDPRFATVAARREHATELVQVVDEAMALRDSADWQHVFEAAGLTDFVDQPVMGGGGAGGEAAGGGGATTATTGTGGTGSGGAAGSGGGS